MLQVEDDCVIARDTTLMSRSVVWYVPGSEAASRLQELPDDLERCPVSELTLPAGPQLPGVLLVDLPGDEASARALAVAQRDGLPVVALVDDGGADAIIHQRHHGQSVTLGHGQRPSARFIPGQIDEQDPRQGGPGGQRQLGDRTALKVI